MKCRAVAVAIVLAASLAACGADDSDEPAAPSPGVKPSPSATASDSPSPTASKSPRRTEPSGRPIAGRAPPPWLGKRVLPRTADGFGEVRRTPAVLVQRRFNLPDQLPALPGQGVRLPGDFAGTEPGDRSLDLEAGVPGGCDGPGLGAAGVLGIRRPTPHRRAPGQRVGGRRDRDGVPAALRGAVPDGGDADHPARRAGRPAHRRRQQHRRVRLPADDRARRRTPSTPTGSQWT